MKTKQQLLDERAAQLNIIDDIIRTATAENRGLTDDERLRHDAAVAAIEGDDGIDNQIARATLAEGDAARTAAHEVRRSRYSVPNVNVKGNDSVGADVTRNLDALLWATADSVKAANGANVPVEQVVVRNKDGHGELQAPRIADFRPADREAIRSFQKTVADMAVFGMLVDRDANTSAKGFEVARNHRAFKDRWGTIMRALDVDTAAEGGNWVPTGIGADMHEKVRAAGKVAALFDRIDIPTNPWKWPIEGGDATAYRVAEPVGDAESKFSASTSGTAAATFDAEIFGVRQLISRSLDADSALAILPFVQRKTVQAFVDAEEKAILDGDTDGTHQDSDIGASTTAAVTAWDGLRKRGLAETTQAITTTSVANLALLRKAMGKWGVNPADLAFIVGVSSYLVLQSDSNLLTVDKMGPNATILSGQVGSLFGVPVIVSEWVRENLNASGVYDGVTTTKTYALCVNRREWAMGQRMALDIQTDDSIYRETFQRVMVGFMREDFQSIASASTDDNTSIGFNITSGS